MASNSIPRISNELQAKAQQNLVDFLGTELELGYTFAKTAELEASMNNREHFELAKKHATSAIETIHRFESRITDSQVQQEIRKRAEDLQSLLDTLGVDSSQGA